ncbi:DUF4266 domain-containing protein [Tenacibaculum piscium]|uniref:DUF4266 domain-containing protein n=1 Tax=Tenacibaculum piscium TaxID=1458515 RepID=UPI00187B6EBF|nr:DUF4266 domain-containing protein [Tenacibaculum piscium]MBE7689399.1 DUF4266 domain-containing protein [Tenacibaculum piscium]
MKNILYKLILFTAILAGMSSCTSVKAYQSQFLSDYYMEQGPLSIESLSSSGFSYREGVSGGEGGKVGGGCGCN